MRDIPDLAENGNFKEFENSISKRQYPIFINTIRVLYGFQEIYPDSNGFKMFTKHNKSLENRRENASAFPASQLQRSSKPPAGNSLGVQKSNSSQLQDS